jgi:hypothetical protein
MPDDKIAKAVELKTGPGEETFLENRDKAKFVENRKRAGE